MRLSLVCHNLLIVLLACLCVGTAAHLGKAAASSGTYGFNAGLEIDLDVLEEQLSEAQQRSVASTLSAGNTITINANNTATVQGSHLQAGKKRKKGVRSVIHYSTDFQSGTSSHRSNKRGQVYLIAFKRKIKGKYYIDRLINLAHWSR